MSNTKKFSQKALVLHTAAALFAMSAHAVPYQQGSSAIATVDAGERVEKITDITAAKKRDGSINKKPAVGSSETDFNRAGNPVRIIWYGNPKDNDSKIAQTSALNNGFIHGKVNVEATRTTSKSEKGSTVDANGMANAIDALGWTPHTNPNSVEYSLTDGIVNNGIAEGEAKL